MNGSVMNRSVMNVVCFEWSVMNGSGLKGNHDAYDSCYAWNHCNCCEPAKPVIPAMPLCVLISL